MGSQPLKGTYSASRVGAILGLSPYTTQFEAWQKIMEEMQPGFNEKKGYEFPVFEDNAATRWGLAFENAITSLVENKYETKIIDREKLFTKQIEGVTFSAHIDGKFINENVLNENKTTNERAFHSIKDEYLRWGEELTDEVPPEYQTQCAVQMLCSDTEEAKLHVLIFPKHPEELEDLGWKTVKDSLDVFSIVRNENYRDSVIREKSVCPFDWASTLDEMGFLKSYTIQRNEKLEAAIITAVRHFNDCYITPEIPPECTTYEDVRRMLKNPLGTIVATNEIADMVTEYSEITRQTGSRGPMVKRKEILKTEILKWMQKQEKNDWEVPEDKLVLVSPDGGGKLISFSKSGFRAKRA